MRQKGDQRKIHEEVIAKIFPSLMKTRNPNPRISLKNVERNQVIQHIFSHYGEIKISKTERTLENLQIFGSRKKLRENVESI